MIVVGAVRKLGRKKGVIYLDCRCVCGALLTARRDSLQAGSPRSCPACRGPHPTATKPEEMIGRPFHHLVVRAEHGRDEDSRNVLWLVECECGRTRTAKTSALRSGQVRSCGQCGHGKGQKRKSDA